MSISYFPNSEDVFHPEHMYCQNKIDSCRATIEKYKELLEKAKTEVTLKKYQMLIQAEVATLEGYERELLKYPKFNAPQGPMCSV